MLDLDDQVRWQTQQEGAVKKLQTEDFFAQAVGFLEAFKHVQSVGFFESFSADIECIDDANVTAKLNATGIVPKAAKNYKGIFPFADPSSMIEHIRTQLASGRFKITYKQCEVKTADWRKRGLQFNFSLTVIMMKK